MAYMPELVRMKEGVCAEYCEMPYYVGYMTHMWRICAVSEGKRKLMAARRP